MATTQLNEMRKKMFRQFEEQLKVRKPEDSCCKPPIQRKVG